MLLSRLENWYRPYFVTVNNKKYQIDFIRFYKDDKVLVSTSSGWLERQNGTDIASLELPVDVIKTRRKECFDGNVFIISKGKNLGETSLLADIFIPAEMFNIQFIEYVIKYKSQVRAVYKGSNDIYIDTYIKSLDGELNSIAKEYEVIYTQCKDYKLMSDADSVLEKLKTLISLTRKYIDERNRINSLTIDDIEI